MHYTRLERGQICVRPLLRTHMGIEMEPVDTAPVLFTVGGPMLAARGGLHIACSATVRAAAAGIAPRTCRVLKIRYKRCGICSGQHGTFARTDDEDAIQARKRTGKRRSGGNGVS